MSAWASFIAGWRQFFSGGSAVMVAVLNFLLGLLAGAIVLIILSIAGFPVMAMLKSMSGLSSVLMLTNPQANSFLPNMISSGPPVAAMVAIAVIAVCLCMYILSATLNSLLDVINGEFAIRKYFFYGYRYIGRAFIAFLTCIGLVLCFAVAALLLFLIFNRINFPVANIILSILLFFIFLSLVMLVEVFMIKYITGRESRFGEAFAQSFNIIRTRYFSLLLLLIILTVSGFILGLFSIGLDLIPVLGTIISQFIYAAVNLIFLMSVIFFIQPEKPLLPA